MDDDNDYTVIRAVLKTFELWLHMLSHHFLTLY